MTTNKLSIKNLRLLSADTDFLDRKIGSSGEIFYDRTDNAIRYFDGIEQGGFALAIDNLSNVSTTAFRAKSVESRLGTVIYTVTIVGPQAPDVGNKYVLNGVYRPIPNFVVGYTYVFNQDDATNVYFPNASGTTVNRHPLNFSADNLSGERGGGTSYLNNVVYLLNGVPVSQTVYVSSAFDTATSRQVRITITNDTPATLYYWCYLHLAMGNSISVADPGSGSGSGSATNLVAGANITIINDIGTNTTTISSSASDSFRTISIAGQDNIIADSATDTLTFVAGAGISLTSNSSTDAITVTNSTSAFSTIAVGGQTPIAADSQTDTLTLAAGSNILITTNDATDTVTIAAATGNFTFAGSTINTSNGSPVTITPNLQLGGTLRFPDNTVQTTATLVGPAGPEGPPGASGDGSGDVISVEGGYLDNAIVRYSGTSGTTIQNSTATLSDAGLLTVAAFSGSGAALTALNATQLTTGTVPDARFPATLPAASGVNLTALNATNLGSGTVPDARFPATLPAASGVNLTALNATNLASGTVPVARLGTAGTRDATTFLRGDNTWAVVEGGGAASNSFVTIEVAGQTPVEADSATDTLTLVAGANVTITTSPLSDTITISSAAGGVSTFSALTEAVATSLTIDKVFLPAITMLTVTNNGSFSYLFDQYGATENPTIYAVGGMTIAFNLIVAGHPFLIQDGAGVNYNTGLIHVSTTGVVTTGASAQGQVNGTLYWKVPSAISGGYRYICSVHAAMVGAITVKNIVSL